MNIYSIIPINELGKRKVIKTVTGSVNITMSELVNSIFIDTKALADAGKEFIVEIDGVGWGYLNCRYANRNAAGLIFNTMSTFFYSGIVIHYGIQIRSTGSKVEDYNSSIGTPHTDHSNDLSEGITLKLIEII